MNEHNPATYHFFVDNKRFDTDSAHLTTMQIKELAGVPANYQLFLEEPGHAPDRPLSDNETIDLQNPPKHFYAVPPATFGCA